ncbi:MAG: hypothetical protein ACYCST_21795, partial [Acidimicrobiales bacterium]
KFMDIKTLDWTKILSESVSHQTIKYIDYISNLFGQSIDYTKISIEAAQEDNIKVIFYIEKLIGIENLNWELIAETGASSDYLAVIKFAAERNAKRMGLSSMENALDWNAIVDGAIDSEDTSILEYANDMSKGNLDWENIKETAITNDIIPLLKYLITKGLIPPEYLDEPEEEEEDLEEPEEE